MNISASNRRKTQYLRPEMETKVIINHAIICDSLMNNSSEDIAEDRWEF